VAINIDTKSLYNNICIRIYTLEYPPGEALRDEELANEFGVSRTPIRQVLQNLEYNSLVTSKPSIGSIPGQLKRYVVCVVRCLFASHGHLSSFS
jgi:DNA-binding FadR family transcriptional regulator